MNEDLPRHNLPPRDYERFVGRQKELEELRRLLLPYPKSRHHLVTIDGIGGIGKSALALESAYTFHERYAALPEAERFDAIVWVSAKRSYLTAGGILERRQSFRALDDLYVAIAQVLDYPAITRAPAEEQRTVVEQALGEQRTLLILDNLETVDDEELLDFLRLLPDPTKAIVTTRHRIDVAFPVRLTGMPHEDALALIAQESARKAVALAHEEREELWRRTGGVPLAIVWSIGLIGLGGSVESVLRRLGQGQSDIARFCFEESVARIRGRDAHRLLLALSLFASDASREALGVVAGLGEDEFGRDLGLEELLRLSLVNKEGERFGLLPLTRSFVQNEATTKAEWMERAREQLYNYFYDLLGGWSDDWHRHDRVERELPNIFAVIDASVSGLRYVQTSENTQIIDPETRPQVKRLLDFISKITRTCRHRGYWSDCERLYGIQINIARAINATRYSGWACYFQGRTDFYRGNLEAAQRWALRAFTEWQRGGNKDLICFANRLLGLVALHHGNIDEATTLLTTALEDYKQSRDRMSSLQNFSESMGDLAHWKGDSLRAASWYQQAIDQSQQANDLPYLASNLLRYGQVILSTGDTAGAQTYYEESLKIAQECGRMDAIAKAAYSIAALKETLGESDSAQLNARQALDLFRRLGMKREQAEAEELLAQLSTGD